jgi:hypothetical protein
VTVPRKAPEVLWSESDPRWRFAVSAVHTMYAELDPSDAVRQVTVSFEDSDFRPVIYAMSPDESEPRRYMCTDPEVADDAFDRAYVDITPDSSADLAGGDVL